MTRNGGWAYGQQVKELRISAEEELRLWPLALAGDMEAKHKIVNNNLGLVLILLNKKYKHMLARYEQDLIQEGNLGLLTAVKNFDYKKGFKLSAFATPCIISALERFLQTKHRPIRIPVHKEKLIAGIKKAADELECALCRKPTPEEIARGAGVKIKVVNEYFAIQAKVSEVSYEETGSSEAAVHAKKCPENQYDPERACLERATRSTLASLLAKLSGLESSVLKRHYGLFCEKCQTLTQIGLELGLTLSVVKRIEISAKKKLSDLAKGFL